MYIEFERLPQCWSCICASSEEVEEVACFPLSHPHSVLAE